MRLTSPQEINWVSQKRFRTKSKEGNFPLPVISSPAVRWDVGEPAKAIEPKVAPPSVPNKNMKQNWVYGILSETRLAYMRRPPKQRARRETLTEVHWTTDRNNLCPNDLTSIWKETSNKKNVFNVMRWC